MNLQIQLVFVIKLLVTIAKYNQLKVHFHNNSFHQIATYIHLGDMFFRALRELKEGKEKSFFLFGETSLALAQALTQTKKKQ